MTTCRIIPAVLLAALATALPAGCTWKRVEAPPPPVDPLLDPCPSRLHNVAGAVLAYYLARGQMPPDLDSIRRAGGDLCPPLECPESRAPYVCHPEGLEVPGLVGRVVLYDAAAVHGGRRWGLVVRQTGATVPLIEPVLLPAGAIQAPR